MGIFYEIPSFSVCILYKTPSFIRNYIQVTIYIYNYNNIQALIPANVIQNLQMRVYDVYATENYYTCILNISGGEFI